MYNWPGSAQEEGDSIVKARDFVAMLKEGKKPLVKLTDMLWDESWGAKGMIARITKFIEHPHDGNDMIELDFDYNENKEHNLTLQSHGYYLRSGEGTGTAFEAGMMNINNIHEGIYFELSQDVPVVLADSPILAEYVKSGSKLAYVEWLEDELKRTREAYRGCLGLGERLAANDVSTEDILETVKAVGCKTGGA